MIKLIQDDILKADFTGVPPINLAITSPPYNVDIKYDEHKDTLTYDDYLKWNENWIAKLFAHMPDDGRLCVNVPFSMTPAFMDGKKNGAWDINYPVAADFTAICQRVGFKFWRTVVWDKNMSMKTCWGSWRSASAPFMRDPSESILIFYKKQWKRLTKGVSTISGPEFMSWTKNVWTMKAETNSDHPAPFPPELPLRCIKLFSYVGDTICDPFMGSGTTGDVAVRWDRNFVGIEKSGNYFTSAKERIEGAELQASASKIVIPNPAEAF